MRFAVNRRQNPPDLAYLLRAIFLNGEPAVEAWHTWNARVDLAGPIARESYRFFPQLARQMEAFARDDPLLGTFKGISRHTWYRNNLLIEHVVPFLDQLARAGADPLVLGAAALLLRSGSDHGLYPIDAFNILIHPDKSALALDQLDKSGWQSVSGILPRVDGLLENSTFVNAAGDTLCVHWSLLPVYAGGNLNEDVWREAETVSVRGTEVCVQNPADQLLCACTRGMHSQDVSFYARAGEVITLLNAFDGKIDWHRFLEQAEQRRLLLDVRSIIDYIQRDLETPMPPIIGVKIKTRPFSFYEQIEHDTTIGGRSLVKSMCRLWFRYKRLTVDDDLWWSISRFPAFLRHRWQLQHGWQVPLHAVKLIFSSKPKWNEHLSGH